MELKLLDYNDDAKIVDIGDIDNIGSILIRVLSGDEVAVVTYKDFTCKNFDSSCSRLQDCFDGEYYIYWYRSSDNLIDDPEFQSRKSSYWYWRFI